jgi:hypothetical protein
MNRRKYPKPIPARRATTAVIIMDIIGDLWPRKEDYTRTRVARTIEREMVPESLECIQLERE